MKATSYSLNFELLVPVDDVELQSVTSMERFMRAKTRRADDRRTDAAADTTRKSAAKPPRPAAAKWLQ